MSALTPQAVARALGGEVIAGGKVRAPGPGHSLRDRSLAFELAADAPDGFVVHSFAGDDWRDCRDHVRHRLGLGRSAPTKSHSPAIATPPADDRDRIERAGALWRESGSIENTPAVAYLASRGVSYQGEALRWHPSCPFGQGERHGCMIGLVRNVITNVPQAIHRTAIDAHGRKIDRKAYGPIAGGAVKLTDDMDVTKVIAIGEGIETTLSIPRLPLLDNMPVWACLNARGIEAFPALPGIESVWIAADNDASGTGQNAARSAGERLYAAGIDTIILTPTAVGTDLNDRVARRG